ncbi:MAG: pantoate--beta-alanine ligase [Sideroxydans sp.]|nr:pantoate--beta-alanine ligase [Sideroxydans sp.]
MEIISSVAALRERLHGERSVALVPTMGNLHEGHLDLVRIARQRASCVVVSIFVNPLQFGPGEDLDKYPRTLEADCVNLAGLADVVFVPAVSDMYPVPQEVFVELPPVASELCGAARPGHFRGMATVVLKLFSIVQPQLAVFGKKDYQQLHLVRQMTRQFNLPIEVIGGETGRAPDGLALSSRNQYLNAVERTEAVFLHQTLVEVRQALLDGMGDIPQLEREASERLAGRGWRVDYVAVRAQATLGIPQSGERELVVLAAARLGNTRLIDNLEVCLEP